MNGEVVFPETHTWDSGIQGVAFPALRDGSDIACIITRRALQKAFGVYEQAELEQAFVRNRPRIEKLAKKKIEFGLLESDGRVIITGDEVELL